MGVAAIPVPVFCHPEGAERTRSLLRFAFCKKTEVLEEAADGSRRSATGSDGACTARGRVPFLRTTGQHATIEPDAFTEGATY